MGVLPIIARDANYLRYATYVRETAETPRCPDDVPVRDLPATCREYAKSPGELFAKLDDWGFESLVIPHGTTWGMYTPQGADWEKQLSTRDHDPLRQRLVEIYSGHGNIEEHRAWRAVEIDEAAKRDCPAPRENYTPACWQAGEVIRKRCAAEGSVSAEVCDERAGIARQRFADAPSGLGHLAIPGSTAMDWRDAGQCRDCFLPAFNSRPGSSVQAMLARSVPGPNGDRLRFRFGIIGASDIHTARPGTGYKEQSRVDMSDARMARVDLPVPSPADEPIAESRVADPLSVAANDWIERDRAASFFYTGGLMARETYATSGPRILLWFDLLNPDEAGEVASAPMGSIVQINHAPEFEVRAAGSRPQLPGCSDAAIDAIGSERLDRLCGGECFRPADSRRRISRIEVIRIRPQLDSEDDLTPLIEDPWQSLACDPETEGCRVRFSDPDFVESRRDTVYYVRAIEEPSLAVNGETLRCEGAACERMQACDPCAAPDDDCLGTIEERAWSSPVFVDWLP